jgi:tetratricopeptide (TPR) repeat protein
MPKQKSPHRHVDDPAGVGRRLREARLRAGLSQRGLSFEGCTAAYVSRIEAGERVPSLQLVRELAVRLGVSPEWLATGVEQPELLAELRLADAELALRLDDLDEAERLYESALHAAPDADSRAAASAGLGQLAFRRGDPREAIDRLEQAFALLPRAGLELAAHADTLGRAYATAGELESAIAVFERFLKLAEEKDELVERVRFGVLLANALIDSGAFGRAEEQLGGVLGLVGETSDPVVRARLYWSQSRLHALQQDTGTAARYARQALEILELTEHVVSTARAHQLLAFIELERGDADQALDLLQRGRELLGDEGGIVEHAKFRLEEARALAQLGRTAEAGALAMELAGVLREADPLDAARSFEVLGGVFEQIGRPAQAREVYELAVEMLERLGRPYVSTAYARLAALLEAEGHKDEALELLRKALDVRTHVPRR